MKLLIVRHAEPDYSIDSLTPTGWEEAKILADRLCKLDVKAFYCSPLGRAKDTASFTLKALNREAKILPWLREIPIIPKVPHTDTPGCAWDWLPEHWTTEPDFFLQDRWAQTEAMANAGMPEYCKQVTDGLDQLLADHGYVREGKYYRAVHSNQDTIVLFCHFGLECVLLGHLLHLSPMVLWHSTCAAPTSVTIVNTEERREGIAGFRMSTFGDTSHLYAANTEPSFAARFCETYATRDPNRD